MAENEQMTNEVEAPTPEQVLIEMREKMVPREEAAKWQNKYNELFQSVANGTYSGEDTPTVKSESELKADYEDNIRRLADTSKSIRPLELFERTLAIDDYLTSHGERSCFAPSDGDITPEIARSCDNTRALLQSVIAQADGSDEVALAYLGNHLTDPVGMAALRRAR